MIEVSPSRNGPGLLMIAFSFFGLLTFPLASCHTTPIPTAIGQSETLPPGTEPAVRSAEEIGKAMFEQDAISARATDALLSENILQSEKRVRGWLTRKAEGHWLVRFIGMAEAQDPPFMAYYNVRFPVEGYSKGEITRLDPAQPLEGEELAMFGAREAALRAMPSRCSDRYNPVILPGNIAHADGWVVYLLAATMTPGEVVIGGHFRVELSPTGTEVKRVLPLSKSCLRLPPFNRPGSQQIAAMTTHLISDTPIETHVYLSLLHRTPIYVSTDLGVWKVEGGKIQFEQKRKS